MTSKQPVPPGQHNASKTFIRDPDAESFIHVGTCALAPVPGTFLAGITAGFNPLQLLVVANLAFGAANSFSNVEWHQNKRLNSSPHIRQLKVAKRAASMQQLAAVTTIPSLGYDAYRVSRQIGQDGISLIPGASLAFTVAATAGLAWNAFRAGRVKAGLRRELAALQKN